MDLSQLPLTHQSAITDEYLDEMGHMNVMWYTHHFDLATAAFFDSFGMGMSYFEGETTGAFAMESHTRYLVEVLVGQSISLRTRGLGRSQRRIHFMHFMTIEETGRVAATTELVGVHIDLTTRRSAPLPFPISSSFDAILEQHRQLDWDAPICGVMGP